MRIITEIKYFDVPEIQCYGNVYEYHSTANNGFESFDSFEGRTGQSVDVIRLRGNVYRYWQMPDSIPGVPPFMAEPKVVYDKCIAVYKEVEDVLGIPFNCYSGLVEDRDRLTAEKMNLQEGNKRLESELKRVYSLPFWKRVKFLFTNKVN